MHMLLYMNTLVRWISIRVTWIHKAQLPVPRTEYMSMHLIFLLFILGNMRTDFTYQEFEEKPHVLV